jgi:alpha/beta superfamily hydrolase
MATAAPDAERLTLSGPAGDLEALIETPRSATAPQPRSFGVVLHPHPLHGGTMDNKVVHTLARAFQEHGAPTVRFNFRGVGRSEGSFADGIGETEDALAVIAAGRERWPDAQMWLGGFSFGAAVALRAASRAQPQRLVTVAPATTRVDLSDIVVPDIPWLLVHGEADDVVDPNETLAWANGQAHPPRVTLLPACGHFFHGKLIELRDAVNAFLAS